MSSKKFVLLNLFFLLTFVVGCYRNKPPHTGDLGERCNADGSCNYKTLCCGPYTMICSPKQSWTGQYCP